MKTLGRGRMASKWQRQNLNVGWLALESALSQEDPDARARGTVTGTPNHQLSFLLQTFAGHPPARQCATGRLWLRGKGCIFPPISPPSLVHRRGGDGPAPLPDPDGEHAEEMLPLQPAREHDQAWEEIKTYTYVCTHTHAHTPAHTHTRIHEYVLQRTKAFQTHFLKEFPVI